MLMFWWACVKYHYCIFIFMYLYSILMETKHVFRHGLIWQCLRLAQTAAIRQDSYHIKPTPDQVVSWQCSAYCLWRKWRNLYFYRDSRIKLNLSNLLALLSLSVFPCIVFVLAFITRKSCIYYYIPIFLFTYNILQSTYNT